MYFADIASSPFYCGWNWRTGWARTSIAGSENEGKIEMGVHRAGCPGKQTPPILFGNNSTKGTGNGLRKNSFF
jgi:hypothetical protein